MSEIPVLSIVIAVKDATKNLPAIFDALHDIPPDVEILLCVAGRLDQATPAGLRAIVLTAPDRTLVPLLWRDGIVQSRSRRVAITTAQCIPTPGWIARARTADVDQWAGTGGAIANDQAASATNWAIFFLRYNSVAHPITAGETEEIAADNAVYDRDAIVAHPDLLADGFWEPSFHRRFRASGRKLVLDPGLVVIHHGLVSARDFTLQRHAHGRAFGIERGGRIGRAATTGLMLCSPILPALMLVRIISRVFAMPTYRTQLLRALPWLIWFTLAWVSGEALGYAASLVRSAGQGGALGHG